MAADLELTEIGPDKNPMLWGMLIDAYVRQGSVEGGANWQKWREKILESRSSTLSYESRIHEKLLQLHVTDCFLSQLAEVDDHFKLTHALRAVRPLTIPEGEMFLTWLWALEQLANDLELTEIGPKDPDSVRTILRIRERGEANWHGFRKLILEEGSRSRAAA
jgi:hypothetical protein